MRVTTAAEAALRDADAIAAGVDGYALMHAAGAAAADFIIEKFADTLQNGVIVYAGAGNNGGDAYIVAALLQGAGITVALTEIGAPGTNSAKRAAALFYTATENSSDAVVIRLHYSQKQPRPQHRCVIVDGILGTGQHGELRDAERQGALAINRARSQNGAIVVALDLPTGVNATTGEIATDAVRADCTLSFGTMKRAHVLRRDYVGHVVVLDIGLGHHADKDDGAWLLADPQLLSPLLPAIAWDSHKGRRGRVAIVGGAEGMAGAIVLASRAALRSGAGLVYAHVAKHSVLPLQIAVPQVVAREWTELPVDIHAAAIGPGFGRSEYSRRRLDDVLRATAGVPTVLDADALTLLATTGAAAGATDTELDEAIEPQRPGVTGISRLRAIAKDRAVVCTPHAGEFATLIGEAAAGSLHGRVVQAQHFSANTGVTLLLKGTPTVIVSPERLPALVVARGTAVLATGGSGDLLTGIIGALLAQGAPPRVAAAVGAWIHGRAAEIATVQNGSVRGVTLDEVLVAMPAAWSELAGAEPLSGFTLAQLPAL